jgi:hypothetical protein
MFDTYVFGTHIQTARAAATCLEEITASPTDCSFPLTLTRPTCTRRCIATRPQGPINEIVHQLAEQGLVVPENLEPPVRCRPASSSISESTTEALVVDDTPTIPGAVRIAQRATRSLPNLRPVISHTRGTVACRRLQRQLHVQLQSCSNHIREISTLVEDMVTTQAQCRLHRFPLPSPENEHHLIVPDLRGDQPVMSLDVDEGFIEMDEDEDLPQLIIDDEMTLRRASTPSGIQKYSVARWRKSSECVSAVNVHGRAKVRCVPRMRRRGTHGATTDGRH